MSSKTFVVLVLLLALFQSLFALRRINIGGSLRDKNPIHKLYANMKVGVITAAGSRSDSTALIRNLLAAGAKSVEWLPFQRPCGATVRNPEMVKKIESLDAMYFTGGRPENLHYCLFGDTSTPKEDTPALKAIKKLKLVGGSSAGSLVQPKFAVLTTGYPSSYETLRTGKMAFSKNGTEMLTSHVLVDVHFSERGRQGRLFVLQRNANLKYAYGIDEDTSMVTDDKGNVEIIGTSGVFVYQKIDEQNTKFHFLTHGDKFDENTGKVKFAKWKKKCPPSTVKPSPSRSIFGINQFRTKAIQVAQYSEKFELKNFQGSNPVVEVTLSRKKRAFCGEFEGKQYTSFKNFNVKMEVKRGKDITQTGDEPLPEDYWKWEL
eukprot:gene3957-7213_t